MMEKRTTPATYFQVWHRVERNERFTNLNLPIVVVSAVNSLSAQHGELFEEKIPQYDTTYLI